MKSSLDKCFGLMLAISLWGINALHGQVVQGSIVDESGKAVANARITVFNADTSVFFETRSQADGQFRVDDVSRAARPFKFGVAARGYEYVERSITFPSDTINWNIELRKESNPGWWNIMLQSPKAMGGTDLGALLPDGTIYYCHSTQDPFIFDPSLHDIISAPGHTAIQGGAGPALLTNGKVMFAGGSDQKINGPGIKKVKTYDPVIKVWTYLPDLLDNRWYPTLAPLFDGKFIIAGGAGLNNPMKEKSSEVYDPETGVSVLADTLIYGNEVSPIVPLYNGRILITHRPPQLFNPVTMQWDAAADFIQANRMPDGDPSDHQLILLPDGRVLAVGYKSFTTGNPGVNLELYDPKSDDWSLLSNFMPTRSRAKAVLLPDERVLVMGGYKEDPNDPSSINTWGYMDLTDQYDPVTDTWRRLAHMNYKREYHAIMTLIPDGRVIAVGGEGAPGTEPPLSIIEAFSPPYLFRGIRPVITNLSDSIFRRGEEITFDVSHTEKLTKVLLIANSVWTQSMNSGNNRCLPVEFTQAGNTVTVVFPADSLKLMPGWYMLFAMVDDIPSTAKIILIEKGPPVISAASQLTGESFDFKIFPNPTRDQIRISISPQPSMGMYSISLINCLGSLVYEEKTERAGLSEGYVVNLPSTIPPGLYFIRISNKAHSQVALVCIQ